MFRLILLGLIGRHLYRKFEPAFSREGGGKAYRFETMSKNSKKKDKKFWSGFGIATVIGLALFQPGSLLGVALVAGIGYLVGMGVSTASGGLNTETRNEPGNRSMHYRTVPVHREEAEPEPQPEVRSAPSTGDARADEVIRRGRQMIQQIKRENVAITDPVLTAQMDELEQRCSQIFDTVTDSPDKAPMIRKFMDYYLPTTLKMLASYRTMTQRGVSYQALIQARDNLVRAMDMVLTATRKLQDNLYRGEMLDMSTDIDVLEQMLMRDGFKDGAEADAAPAKGTAAMQQMQSTGAPVMNFPEEDTSPASYFQRKARTQKPND